MTSEWFTALLNHLRRNSSLFLLILLAAPLLLIDLDRRPAAWFDEGYKMNAAYTLAEYGVYGTLTYDGFVPFDPGTSSGPIDLGLTALAFRIFGVGLVQARLVSALFGLVSVFILYRLAEHLYGQRAAFGTAAVAVFFPALGGVNFIGLSRQVLSEAAAVALILAGLLVWLRQFQKPVWWKSLGAGLLIGLGLLSKTQIAVALVPALFVVVVVRVRWGHQNLSRESMILIAILATIGGWMLLGNLLTPPATRAENSALLLDAIRTNILTDLFLPGPSWAALAISLLMLTSSMYTARYLARRERLQQAAVQGELVVGISILFTLAWFAMWSVGWPRYSYFGFLLSGVVIGSLLWKMTNWIGMRLSIRSDLFMGVIIALLLVWNASMVLSQTHSDGLTEAMDFARQNIPPNAVVETWDWQVDIFLGTLERIHHPPQSYLFEAIRQFSHYETPFSLDYDVLQAEPDYLIIGPFAAWTGIYAAEDVENAFTQLGQFGDYRVYRRR